MSCYYNPTVLISLHCSYFKKKEVDVEDNSTWSGIKPSSLIYSWQHADIDKVTCLVILFMLLWEQKSVNSQFVRQNNGLSIPQFAVGFWSRTQAPSRARIISRSAAPTNEHPQIIRIWRSKATAKHFCPRLQRETLNFIYLLLISFHFQPE